MADQGINPNSPFATAMREKGMDKADASVYDSFRENYFNQRIASRLTPADRQKKRDEFMQRTQRPKMGVVEGVSTLVNLQVGTMTAGLDRTASTVLPEKHGGELYRERAKEIEALNEADKKKLAWHGQPGAGIAETVGGTSSFLLESAAGSKVLAPLGAVPTVSKAVAAFPKLLPAVGRVLGFSTLMSAEAEPGKRTSAFTTGMGWGVAGELGGAALGRLWKYFKSTKALPTPGEVDSLLKDMAIDQAPASPLAKDIHRALGEDLREVAKEPGYLHNIEMHLDDSLHNPMVALEDGEGRQRISPIATKHGVEKAFNEISQAIDSKWKVSKISHNEFDQPFVNDLMAKLKERYEPWSPTPSQIATGVANKGIDIGGGTARMDQRVLKVHYAKEKPTTGEAKHFIDHAIGDQGGARVDSLMQQFESVWNPFGNWIERAAAASKLEEQGLHDILPSPEVRARWKPSEGMNLPAIFNEKGWYDTLDRWKGRTDAGDEIKLDLRQKEHLTNSMKTLWDPATPTNSSGFKSALRALTQYELNDFLPGRLLRDDVASLLNEGRVGTEGASKATKLVNDARSSTAPVAMREHLYQQIGRLAEIFSKQKDIDQLPYIKQYGRATVASAMDMAALMWERGEGDILQVKWDEPLLQKGIREGILPPIDPSGKPLTQWFDKGEEHLAQGLGIDDTNSLKKASLESRVLRLAEMYNVDPKNIDKELLAEVGEAEVARAKEIADAAKKSNVSVYDRSVMEEAARLGQFDESTFSPRGLPPSERPSMEPGQPAGLPLRNVRLEEGKVGQFAYKVTRAVSGLPSRIYLLFNDTVADSLKFRGAHSVGPLSDLPPIVKHDLEILAQQNGIELSKTPISMVHRPNAGFEKALSAPLVWHEDAHGMLSQIGFNQATADGKTLRNSDGVISKLLGNIRAQMPERLQKTWDALGRALDQKFEGLYSSNVKGEEGFVHAATAIRYGNHGDLAHFAAVDTSVEHVYETVQEIASKLRQEAGKMAPGASKNFIMDRLGLMEAFSNIDRYKATKEVAEQMFADVGEDLRSLNDHSGQQFFDKFSDIIGKAESSMEGRTYSPNHTAWAEAAGVRQSLYPTQMPPGRTPPPMPDVPIDSKWHMEGKSKIKETLKPTLSWVDWLDNSLNKKWSDSTKGPKYMPIADTVRSVIDNYEAGVDWVSQHKTNAIKFLGGSQKKLDSFGYLMTKDPKYWGQEISKLGFTNDDIANFKQAYQWMRGFQAETGIPVMDYYLRDYQRLAARGFNPMEAFAEKDAAKMGTFQKLIFSGELNPRDLNVGKMIDVLLREGMEKKFTGEPLASLRKLMNQRADGKYILGSLRDPLERFHNYMRGVPDVGTRAINDLSASFEEGINKGLERINKTLPGKFKIPQIDWTSGNNFVRRLILMNYVGNIGAKPALFIRDSTQVLTHSLPIFITNPQILLKGLGSGIKNWERAEMAGATLKGQTIDDVFGDVFAELPTKQNYFDQGLQKSSMLLAPSRAGHNVARRTVFSGVYDETLSAVRSLRLADTKGSKTFQGDMDKFLSRTGLWFASDVRQKQLLSLARDKFVKADEVAKQVGLEMTRATLWDYRRGAQPGFLKTGIGRVFGQYGLWPANHLNFIATLTSKAIKPGPHQKHAIAALGAFAVINYEVVNQSRKVLGLDTSKWFGLAPIGYVGSPHVEFVRDVATAIHEQGSPAGRAAAKRALEYPTQFVPGSGEARILKETYDKPWFKDGQITQDGWRTLGFKMYKPDGPTLDQLLSGDVDPERYSKFELGEK